MSATPRLPRFAYRLIGAVGTSRLVTRLHPVVYRRFGGAGVLGWNIGMRNVIVTTHGVRTGRARDVPLYAVPDGDRMVVIGSNAGRPRDPAWVGNLRADARAVLRDGAVAREVVAYEARGEERDRLWAAAVARYPGYAQYQERAGRPIPVIVLAPVNGAAPEEHA